MGILILLINIQIVSIIPSAATAHTGFRMTATENLLSAHTSLPLGLALPFAFTIS